MPKQLPDRRVIVFLKAPRPGRVKTRLARELGNDVSCQLYERMMVLTCQQAKLSGLSSRIYLEKWSDLGRVKGILGPGFVYRPQTEGVLGERLSGAFLAEFKDGADQCVVIGSDCPAVTAKDMRAGFKALQGRPCVLGPSRDGGYYLMGLNRIAETDRLRRLFRGVSWSSGRVYAQTIVRLRREGFSRAELGVKRDVDTRRDLTLEILRRMY